MILGCDPGLRHVGLCVLGGPVPVFEEVKTSSRDVASALKQIGKELSAWKLRNPGSVVSMERQLSVGGQSSALMFAVQMKVAEALGLDDPRAQVVLPLPVQLRSYIKRVHGGDVSSARATVEHFRETHSWKARISQHCVDAYYLCRLAQDVLEGRWEYKLPTKELTLFPGVILNGGQHRSPQRGSEEAREALQGQHGDLS